MTPLAKLLLLGLQSSSSCDVTEECCEVSFLQTERFVSHTPWLQPAFEHVTIPEGFEYAAPLPVFETHITWLGKIAVGLGALAVLAFIAWSFNEEADERHPDSPRAWDKYAKSPHAWRMFIAMMCMTMYLLNYADRYNISVAIIQISEERGYDKRMQGFIQSAVYFGLLPGTLAFGHLASPDCLGSYQALLLACSCWSVATLLTPICADSSLGLLIFIRIALGFFEAGGAPSTYQLAHQWFPKMQASHLLAASVAGQCAGAAIANAFGALEEWSTVFYIFGVCGLLWCGIFLLFGSNTPADHGYVSEEERLAIEEQQREERREVKKPTRAISLWALLRHSAILGIILAEFTYSFLWYFWLSWMPSFFHDIFRLSTGEAGNLGMMSYLVGMPAPFLWSKVFSSCYKRNGPSSLLNLRLVFVCITFLGAVLGTAAMLLTYHWASALFAMVLVMLVIVALCSKVAGLAAFIVDVGGEQNSARVGGLVHVASAISGSVSNVVVGYFLDSPSLGYPGVFVLTILIALLGLATMVQTAQVSEIEPSEDAK